MTPAGITAQPFDQHVMPGERAKFSVEATGDGLSYQWYIDRNDGRGWVKIEGATGAVYITAVVDADADGYKYRCEVTDIYGNKLTTRTVTLNVAPAPVLPETGDAATPVLWLAMSLLSLNGALLIRKKAGSKA